MIKDKSLVVSGAIVIQCFILSVFFVGCATYGYYYSKPMENKAYKFYPNGITLFKIEGVDLFLSPKNESSFAAGAVVPPVPIIIGKDSPETTHYSQEDFEVEVLLHSREKGFSFNPKEIYLTLESGEVFQPIRYSIREGTTYLPLGKDPHNLLDRDSFRPPRKKKYVEGFEDKYYDLVEDKKKRGIGFKVHFPTATPRPGTPFSLEMKGLKRFDQKILIPRIRYKDKSRYDWTYF